jgi:DNA polymerase-3 subunit delta'
MTEFVAEPRVKAFLRSEDAKADSAELVRASAGAPGHVLAGSLVRGATIQARRLIEAAASANRAAAYKAALAQGAAGARGSFTDTLDALEVLLHERVKNGVSSGDESMATGAAKALEVVERTKEQAAGNVNPQLLTAALLRDMTALIR